MFLSLFWLKFLKTRPPPPITPLYDTNCLGHIMMTRYMLGKNAFWSLLVSFHYSCHNDKSWAVNLGCIYSVNISNG